MIESRIIAEEFDSQEIEVFEEEFITLHNTTYNKNLTSC